MVTGNCIKRLKRKEAQCTDERLKLITDMVTGVRTIKCYGWENHYTEKITTIRNKQSRTLICMQILMSLGMSIYINLGLVVFFFITWL